MNSSTPVPIDLFAINCHDAPTSDLTLADLTHQKPFLDAAAPTFRSMALLRDDHIACAGFPFAASRNTPHELHFPQRSRLPKVLVVNSLDDMRTPPGGAEHVASQIPGAVFVRTRMVGHTSYGREGSVVTEMVDRYFIEGKVPEDGSVVD